MHRVLLVNDCKFENFIMRDMLINLGYEVIISNESNAVSDTGKLKCSLVIANFIMKEKTGDEILKQIKHLHPETKCILSSSNDIKLVDFNNNGIDGVIHTPITKENLKEIIKNLGQSLLNQNKQIRPSFCKYCGEKIEVNEPLAKFCRFCGVKI